MFTEEELDTLLEAQGALPGVVGMETMLGIYRNPDQDLTVFDGMVSSTSPTFRVKASAALELGIDIGTKITVDDTDYTVSDSKKENTGFVRLSLTLE